MRRPSPRILNRTLSITRRAWDRDKARGRIVAAEEVAMLPGTLQAARESRVPDHLKASTAIDMMALFAIDPEVKADDLIADGPVVMSCAGPAFDDPGRGAYFVVFGTRKA